MKKLFVLFSFIFLSFGVSLNANAVIASLVCSEIDPGRGLVCEAYPKGADEYTWSRLYGPAYLNETGGGTSGCNSGSGDDSCALICTGNGGANILVTVSDNGEEDTDIEYYTCSIDPPV